MKRILFTFSLFLVAAPAIAQQDSGDRTPDGKPAKYAAHTDVDFTQDTVIDGHYNRPSGIFQNSRRTVDYPTMILERTHFKADLAHSVGAELKKSPSPNFPK